MPDKSPIEDLVLSDAELVELLKRHGVDRRTVMKLLGVGSVLSFGAGTAASRHSDPHPPNIDPYYGYSAPADENLPGNLAPDHTVALPIDESAFSAESTTDLPFFFEPMGLHIDEGNIVQFSFTTPEHTVTAYHQQQGRQQRVPDDVPSFSSPVMNVGGFWLYEFPVPGVYDVFCAPHELFGMVMRIVVGNPDDEEFDDSFSEEGRHPVTRDELGQLGITTWPYPTPGEVFETEALEVSNIVEEGSVPALAVEEDIGG